FNNVFNPMESGTIHNTFTKQKIPVDVSHQRSRGWHFAKLSGWTRAGNCQGSLQLYALPVLIYT
ncbi:MAG: hypothetical protein WA791_10070, partial [Rhodomicrobium sp.]